MKSRVGVIVGSILVLALAGSLQAADIEGVWTGAFDSQIGNQEYELTFAREEGKLVGSAKASLAGGEARDVELKDVKLEGDALTFHEVFSFQGNEIRIDYTGKVAGDKIELTRDVGQFATETFVAERKPPVSE